MAAFHQALERPEIVAMLLALVTCFCMTLLPVFGGISLLLDPNYRFWNGSWFPFLSIAISVLVFLLAAVTAALLYRRARVQDLNESTMVIVATLFSALLGVSLLVVSLEASQGLNSTARELMQGCSSHGHNVHVLNDYSLVLANIRAQPACAAEASVELCAGYSENKYTSYIKYLEQEFECGPVCSTPAASSFQHERWGSASLVQTDASVSIEPFNVVESRYSSTTKEGDTYLHKRAGGGRVLRKTKGPMVPALMPDGAEIPQEVGFGKVTTSPMPGEPTTTTELPEYWENMKGPGGREPPGAASGFSPKLFNHGYTRASCLPLVATRLQVLAFASNDVPFYEGCGLIFCSLIISMVACVGRGCFPKK
jgi:Kef-type K+ transport system membrane component KefB